jgi:hypothetical protein
VINIKKMVVFYLILAVLVLSGCNFSSKDKIVIEKEEGPFVVRLESEKLYKPFEKENITAMIKYIGDEPELTISHAATLFWFDMTEHTRGIEITGDNHSVQTFTTLKEGQWYKESFEKSGELRNDPFIQEYFNKEGFPVGEYTVKAIALFSLDELNKEEKQIEVQLDFDVKN